jgi:uncharacterized protein YgiM (DUF1202 family)
MARSPLVASLALLVAGALAAAEPNLAPTPDLAPLVTPTPAQLLENAAPAGSFRATLKKNGNVRFAPVEGKIILTLKAGTEVEILGPAKATGWYVVRFPRDGRAWVHAKVLNPVDGGKRWRVIEDQARARDDATMGAGVVTTLLKGEVLEDRGQQVGDWRAVYLPNAVAYISGSVLEVPANLDELRKANAQRATDADAVWTTAQGTYATYAAAAQSNLQHALSLDWDGLARQFDVVARDHADPGVRMAATRLKDGIVNVAAASLNLQRAKGIAPVQHPSDPAATSTGAGGTTPVPVLSVPGVTDVGDPLAPPKLSVPDVVPNVSKPVDTAAVTPAVPVAAQGFVSQQQFEALGVNEVLVDGDSNIVALIKVKPGADIQLSEYYWRWVGVRGEVQLVDQEKHGLGRVVPLIIVDDVTLGK